MWSAKNLYKFIFDGFTKWDTVLPGDKYEVICFMNLVLEHTTRDQKPDFTPMKQTQMQAEMHALTTFAYDMN